MSAATKNEHESKWSHLLSAEVAMICTALADQKNLYNCGRRSMWKIYVRQKGYHFSSSTHSICPLIFASTSIPYAQKDEWQSPFRHLEHSLNNSNLSFDVKIRGKLYYLFGLFTRMIQKSLSIFATEIYLHIMMIRMMVYALIPYSKV